jgi:hypothetical protein
MPRARSLAAVHKDRHVIGQGVRDGEVLIGPKAKGRMKQIVLRAYQLARSGTCASLKDIEERLRSEGFHPVSIQEGLAGPALRANLTKLCEETGRGTIKRRR